VLSLGSVTGMSYNVIDITILDCKREPRHFHGRRAAVLTGKTPDITDSDNVHVD
jgi:hypothetical protein